MTRVYNFSAGPAALPLAVLERAREELLDWHNLGMSVMEISHRGKDFQEVVEESETDLRELLRIPSNYKILFLQGGARSQFAMVPLNLLGANRKANYLNTGIWSDLALNEASRYGEVNIVASSKEQHYREIPSEQGWKIDLQGSYFHFVDNETINGIEFPDIPNINTMPLVSDMSSNILSRPFDVSRFGLIYASAQKNIGPAGFTLVIVKEELLGDVLPFTPSMFNYTLHARANSMYNTPPTFAWYMAGLNFKWLKEQGLDLIGEKNSRKAEKLYQFIDSHDFYANLVNPLHRSRMNVVFSLRDENLNDEFLQQATANGLANLKGHKLVGGMRASIYNAMPEEGVDCLIAFMKDFEKRFG
jgi:phosphoserine aminotransferase